MPPRDRGGRCEFTKKKGTGRKKRKRRRRRSRRQRKRGKIIPSPR